MDKGLQYGATGFFGGMIIGLLFASEGIAGLLAIGGAFVGWFYYDTQERTKNLESEVRRLRDQRRDE
jgi:hypothetical protein